MVQNNQMKKIDALKRAKKILQLQLKSFFKYLL